jgi:hypothetical protein
VFLVERTPPLEFVGLLRNVAARAHTGDARIQQFRTGELDLEFDRERHVNATSEVLHARRGKYRVRHRAARFLCGAGTQAAVRPRPLMV